MVSPVLISLIGLVACTLIIVIAAIIEWRRLP